MQILNWNDDSIPHELWIEKNQNETTKLSLKVIKDIEPEVLSVDLPCSFDTVLEAWKGSAEPISTAYDDGYVYSQVRSLFNVDAGCVIWAVNHIKLADGNKMSLDRLVLVPTMISEANSLKPLS